MSAQAKALKILCPACGRKLDLSDLESFTVIDCPVCNEEIVVPAYLGELLLEEPIGKGPIADVYRALDLTLDREVAAKVLTGEFPVGSDEMTAFIVETKAAAALNHPHVIPIYSCGEEDGRFFVIMQLMDGLSIERKVDDDGPLPLGLALQVIIDTVRALQVATEKEVLHLNLKPSNILTDSDGIVKISDFGHGIVGHAVADRNKAFAASCSFQSPEQIQGRTGELADDIYSAGACLYYLLTGRIPFAGISSAQLLEAKQANHGLAAPRQLRREIPVELSNYVLMLMSAQAAARPQQYDEVLAELERQRKELRKHATDRQRGQGREGMQKALLASHIARRHQSVRPVAAKGKTSRSRLLNLLLLLSVLILAGLVILLWQRQRSAAANQSDDAVHTVVEKITANSVPVAGAVEAEKGNNEAVLRHIERVPTLPARPRPKDLNFHAIEKQLQSYLQQVPELSRERERTRLQYLSTCRDYLLQLMQFAPYEGTDKIYLRNGDVITGTVPFCSEDNIAVRSSGRNSQLRMLKWHELSLDQYILFFDYYARLRSGNMHERQLVEPDIRQSAAEDNFRLALLCDWFGQETLARKYVKLAHQYEPSYVAKLNEFFPRLMP